MNGESIPTAALRRNLAKILLRVQAGEVMHITHYDRPAAVLVPPDVWAEAQAALNAQSPREQHE
jgi:prevent-host-death family protein